MRRWHLTYELKTEFSSPVTGHRYSLRCVPGESEVQKTQRCDCEVFPCSEFTRSRDFFGNTILIGSAPEPHDAFGVCVDAQVTLTGGLEKEERKPWQLGMFRNSTAVTKMGAELTRFYESLPPDGGCGPWERAVRIQDCLWQAFRYTPGSTGFDTDAETAFSQGCGVCQDYAHILLALCRREKLTVRYAAGAIPGEGESHAWVQVWENGSWKGFDPTHNRETDDSYLVFALGRDAWDCRLSHGIFRGGAAQTQQVRIRMEEMT